MKYLKTLGLVAVMATALTAMFGVGSAFASENITLCKVAEEPCKAENHYPIGTALVAKSVGTVNLSGGLGTLKCNSEVKGKITTTGGKTATTITGEITSLTFSGCTLTTGFGTHECTVSSTGLPYVSHLTRTAPTTGSLTVTKPSANISCPAAFLTCTVSAESVTLDALSTNHPAGRVGPAHLTATEQNLTSPNGLCNNSKWSGTYEITSPKPLHISTSA
jgi:hypothetical protein